MKSTDSDENNRQIATFRIGQRLYGIDVMIVQEVTQAPILTPMPLAPPFVKGLINLRGQIATAIGLRELFESDVLSAKNELMTIVCSYDHSLLSFIVDTVGDVIEIKGTDLEEVPQTITDPIRRFIGAVCVLHGDLLSVLDIKKVTMVLNGKETES